VTSYLTYLKASLGDFGTYSKHVWTNLSGVGRNKINSKKRINSFIPFLEC
jgi:hypothetical protein